MKSEQLAGRDFWTKVEHPELGETLHVPRRVREAPANAAHDRRRAPLLGEHNDEIAGEAARPATPAVQAPPSRALPLDGVKVLEFTWVIAGPWGTRYLADYGATVIKVESTTRVDTLRTIAPYKDHVPGAERSAAYATVNAGKLGLTLNLTHPKGPRSR